MSNESLSLLFPDSSHIPVDLHEIAISTNVMPTSNLTVANLSSYIFSQHHHDANNSEVISKLWSDGNRPESVGQIRLIHMGRPLNGETRLSEIRLGLSKVIHVSVRPPDDDDDLETASSKGGVKSKFKSSTNSGGSCCVVS